MQLNTSRSERCIATHSPGRVPHRPAEHRKRRAVALVCKALALCSLMLGFGLLALQCGLGGQQLAL